MGRLKMFQRKRKQCVKCRRTFYKLLETTDQFEGTYKLSPCCKTDYIIV